MGCHIKAKRNKDNINKRREGGEKKRVTKILISVPRPPPHTPTSCLFQCLLIWEDTIRAIQKREEDSSAPVANPPAPDISAMACNSSGTDNTSSGIESDNANMTATVSWNLFPFMSFFFLSFFSTLFYNTGVKVSFCIDRGGGGTFCGRKWGCQSWSGAWYEVVHPPDCLVKHTPTLF